LPGKHEGLGVSTSSPFFVVGSGFHPFPLPYIERSCQL
jgi:hypothetical protein